MNAVKSLINVLLFMVVTEWYRHWPGSSSSSDGIEAAEYCTPFAQVFSLGKAVMRSFAAAHLQTLSPYKQIPVLGRPNVCSDENVLRSIACFQQCARPQVH